MMMRTTSLLFVRTLGRLLVLGSLGLLVACETTPGASSGTPGRPGSLPLNTLDAMYAARSAMTNLADGSAQDPAAARRVAKNAQPILSSFTAQLLELERSFNSADSTQLWEQLSRMGSIYLLDISSFSARDLRAFEVRNMRTFRQDVVDLRRQMEAYTETYNALVKASEASTRPTFWQERIPTINELTTMSVELDSRLRTFSNSLTQLSNLLEESKFVH